MKSILFVCSGNFYRSRFAEVFFNWLAAQNQLEWRAESRGFRLSPNNVGPISPHAAEGLFARGVPAPLPHRWPLVVAEQDFETFDLVIALKEAEHRQKMRDRFPAWADRIDYWHIHDTDFSAPAEALIELERELRKLVQRLKTETSSLGMTPMRLPVGR